MRAEVAFPSKLVGTSLAHIAGLFCYLDFFFFLSASVPLFCELCLLACALWVLISRPHPPGLKDRHVIHVWPIYGT